MQGIHEEECHAHVEIEAILNALTTGATARRAFNSSNIGQKMSAQITVIIRKIKLRHNMRAHDVKFLQLTNCFADERLHVPTSWDHVKTICIFVNLLSIVLCSICSPVLLSQLYLLKLVVGCSETWNSRLHLFIPRHLHSVWRLSKIGGKLVIFSECICSSFTSLWIHGIC